MPVEVVDSAVRMYFYFMTAFALVMLLIMGVGAYLSIRYGLPFLGAPASFSRPSIPPPPLPYDKEPEE